ncbi:MAG: hypothetical protein IJ667_02260 [Synergistaceae bacterium]|nr:hypothetical protein [Synergistaceae bacterium]
MNLNRKFLCGLALLFLLAAQAFAAESQGGAARTAKDTPAMRKWVHENHFADRDGDQRVDLKATYYAAEYVEALVNAEAEKNMWTADELENYKYTLFKTLNLNESIAFHIDFNVIGVPMYAQPFDRHITLLIGKKKYTPSDYDHRFNFKISGQRDGMVYFPRYDPQTGADLLKGVKQIRLILDGAISHAISRTGDVTWIWDITKDKPERLNSGKAANRLEIDRLLKRVDKVNKDKQELQSKLDALNKELSEVNARINQLQAQ